MVQAELSLDAIKVVRNDLSESDLEVVEAPRAPVSKFTQNLHGIEVPLATPGREWGTPAGEALEAGKL
jgi:hypothetical protein